jgi:hypothetical protein
MARDFCTLSIYVPHRFYLPLLDAVARDLGFRSRSICVTQLLEQLFRAHGVLDQHQRPTARALALSPEVAALLRGSKATRAGKHADARRRALLEAAVHSTMPALPARPRRRHAKKSHRR